MTEKELKRLSRSELLEMLLAQSKENEQLRAQLAEARKQLASRRLEIEKAGSIAEASLQLNGVFQAAQEACAQYIENIERLSASQEQTCARMERETREKCDQMIADAQRQSQVYWDEVSSRIRQLCDSYAELKQILGQEAHQ